MGSVHGWHLLTGRFRRSFAAKQCAEQGRSAAIAGHASYCSGGCAANAHAFHGDISKPYDLECQMERKRLECAMAIYAKEHGKTK